MSTDLQMLLLVTFVYLLNLHICNDRLVYKCNSLVALPNRRMTRLLFEKSNLDYSNEHKDGKPLSYLSLHEALHRKLKETICLIKVWTFW